MKQNNKPVPAFPLQDQLKGYSRALFSTWLYHKRFNILFDAGEGVSTSLMNKVFGIRRVFLSHGHADHIAGLVNLLNIRNLGAGDQTADLKVYYPADNKLLEFMIDFLMRTQRNLTFNLEWIPIRENEVIPLEDQKGRISIHTFKTEHSAKQLSLGFNVVEIRRRLKPGLENLSQKEINELIWKEGRDAVAEDFEKIVFTYGGDSRPIDPECIKESLFLCHESTYINEEDDERGFKQHSFLHEVMQTAKEAKVSNLLLMHASLRYNLEEIQKAILNSIDEIKPECRVLLLYGDNIFDASAPHTWRRRMNKEKSELEMEQADKKG